MPGLRRHYTSTLAANAAILLLGIVSGVLAARLLGPEGRGELAAIIVWPTALWVVGSLGMPQTVTFFSAQQPERRSVLLSTSLVIAAAQSGVLIAVGYFLLPLLLSRHRPEVLQLARLFLLTIPLSLFSIYLLNLLQGAMRLDAYNLSRIFLAAWYALVLFVLFLLEQPHLGQVVAWQLGGYAAGLLLNAGLVHHLLRPQWCWDASILRPLLSYAARNQLWAASYHLNPRLDQLAMSVWLAPEALGLYVVAVSLVSPLTITPNAIGIVTLPAAAREGSAHAADVIRLSLRWVLVLLLAGAAALFVLVPYLLPIFFGESFAPAVTACRVLVVAMIPLGLSVVLYESLRALNRPLVPAFAELTGIAATLILLYLLLPRFGYLGAAFASLGAYSAACLVVVGYTRLHLGIRL